MKNKNRLKVINELNSKYIILFSQIIAFHYRDPQTISN